MNTKILAVICFFLFFACLAFGDINGYLAADYLKGQEEGEFPKGSFLDPLFGLVFSVDLSNSIDYLAEFRIQGHSQIEIDQALLGFGSSDAFKLRLGLYLVPFGIYNQFNRPHQTLLIKKPLNVDYAYPSKWRDVGLLVEGQFSDFFYSAYLGNGLGEGEDLRAGQQFEDNNADKGKGGRVGLRLSVGFEAAYSIYSGKVDDQNSRNQMLHGVDLNWTTENWHLFAEYTKGNLKNPEGFSDADSEGFFIQLMLNFGNIRPLASYQKLDYSDEYHGKGFSGNSAPGEGISVDKNRWALGLVYIPVESVFMKLEYDINREEGQKKKDNLLALQVAVSF
jgi:hypothetical protein